MNYTRISADCHIDLPMLAPDLFTSNASAGLKERMPYVTDGPDGPYWTCKNGGSFGLLNGVGPSGQKLVPGQNHRVDIMAATGFYEDGKKGRRRPTDPVLRAQDMDRDGVQAEVIFGILGAATRLNDPVAANEMFRIYNDWLVAFCKHDPARFVGLVMLVGHGADVASDVGAALASHSPGRSATALPHVSGNTTEPAGAGVWVDSPSGVLHRSLQFPDESL